MPPSVQFSSVHSLSRVQLFATPWTAAHRASLHHQLPELTQTHVHRVGDAIQPSHPLLYPSPPALNLSQNQESLAEARVGSGLLQGPRQSAAVHAWDLLKEAPIIFITFRIVWPQVKQQGGTQRRPIKNWIKELLNMAPPIRTRLCRLSHQEASIASYPSPSEGRQNESHNHRKLTNLITWTTALSSSMKL